MFVKLQYYQNYKSCAFVLLLYVKQIFFLFNRLSVIIVDNIIQEKYTKTLRLLFQFPCFFYFMKIIARFWKLEIVFVFFLER